MEAVGNGIEVGLRANLAQSWRIAPYVASPSLSLLLLIFPLICQSEQVVNIGLCGNNLLHFFSYRLVLTIGGFFLCRKLPAFGFERIHVGKLRPGQ